MRQLHLIVSSPFDGREIGDRIEDPAEVERVLASEHSNLVIKVAAPAAPAAQE